MHYLCFESLLIDWIYSPDIFNRKCGSRTFIPLLEALPPHPTLSCTLAAICWFYCLKGAWCCMFLFGAIALCLLLPHSGASWVTTFCALSHVRSDCLNQMVYWNLVAMSL